MIPRNLGPQRPRFSSSKTIILWACHASENPTVNRPFTRQLTHRFWPRAISLSFPDRNSCSVSYRPVRSIRRSNLLCLPPAFRLVSSVAWSTLTLTSPPANKSKDRKRRPEKGTFYFNSAFSARKSRMSPFPLFSSFRMKTWSSWSL